MSEQDVSMESTRTRASSGVDEPEAKRSKTREEAAAASKLHAATKGGGAEEEVKKPEEELQTTRPGAGEGPSGAAITGTSGAVGSGVGVGGGLQEHAAAAAGRGGVAQPGAKGDIKRMMERHQEYLASQAVLQKLPELFPGYDPSEANGFLLWLSQLPCAMHRPRPATSEHGWKAAGEILTVQAEEKIPSVFRKMIDNNFSCLPVLDVHRRYIGLIDNLALVTHALKCFGVMDDADAAKDPAQIAAESISSGGAAAGGAAGGAAASSATSGKAQEAAAMDISKSEAEAKLEQIAAEGSASSSSGQPTGPVRVRGDRLVYKGKRLWSPENKPAGKQEWDPSWWDREDFKGMRAGDLLAELSTVTLATHDSPAVMVGSLSLPSVSPDVLAAPLLQGCSTLFALELLARWGLHRAPILNSERFVTGLISESMLISLISQYRALIPSFLAMPVDNMQRFLLPHRLVLVPEGAVTAEAYLTFVKERVNGGAVVNEKGVLVDVLSTRDLRGIGKSGVDFERLWMIVSDFKETVRKEFPDKTPHHTRYVTRDETMNDVLNKLSDGNLHRVFLCDKGDDGLPRPTAVITQRDVMRMLLVFCGLTLQGEVRVATA